jgi:hypothetical protein
MRLETGRTETGERILVITSTEEDRNKPIKDIKDHIRRLLGEGDIVECDGEVEIAPRVKGKIDVRLERQHKGVDVYIDGYKFGVGVSDHDPMIFLSRSPLARVINAVVGGDVRQVHRASLKQVRFVEGVLSSAQPKN